MTHTVANKANEVFRKFVDSLNDFFDLCLDFNQQSVCRDNATIHWYSGATISNNNRIYASSSFYHNEQFSCVSVNMNSEEASDYESVDSACFAKVNTAFFIVCSLYCI